MCSDTPGYIAVQDLGLTSYRDTWDLQYRTVDSVQKGGCEYLYLNEHRHVYTLGKHGHRENLLMIPKDAEVIRIDRGGDITYHGPGQLVVYPIISLHNHHLGVKAYVDILEETVIRTLADYGIESGRVEGATGVWLGIGTPRERKICAIGVRVSRGVTMHGFALNVNTDLSRFSAINPCGFTDKGVTSLALELGRPADLQAVKRRVVHHFLSLLSPSPLLVEPSPSRRHQSGEA